MLLGASMEPLTLPTFDLSTLRPPWGPMRFAPMAASSRIDKVYHNLSKTILFWPFFWLTFKWTHPILLKAAMSYLKFSKKCV